MRKTTRKIASLVLAGALIVTAVPVSSDAAADVKLSKTSVSLKVKGTKTLKVSKVNKKVTSITKKVFTSKKKSVATVGKSSGKITAKKAGSATITCKVTYKIKSGKKTKKKTATLSCSVTVTKAAATPTKAPATQTSAPASQAPASQAPASGAPASETPASGAPASQAPASGAPTSEAPASVAPTSSASAAPTASASAAPTASASAAPTASAAATPSVVPATAAPAKATATPTPGPLLSDYTGPQFTFVEATHVPAANVKATSIKFEKLEVEGETVEIRISKVGDEAKSESTDGYGWSDADDNKGKTFTGLASGTKYTFAARVKKTVGHESGTESTITVTTKTAAEDAEYDAYVKLKEKLEEARENKGGTVALTSNVIVPAGNTLTVYEGVTLSTKAFTLTNVGDVTNKGEIDIEAEGGYKADGTINNVSGAIFKDLREAPVFVGEGKIVYEVGSLGYLGEVPYIGKSDTEDVKFALTKGSITLKKVDGENANMILGDGTKEATVELKNSAAILSGQIAEISEHATLTITGTLVNNGTITNSGKIANNGTISGSGTYAAAVGSWDGTGSIDFTGSTFSLTEVHASNEDMMLKALSTSGVTKIVLSDNAVVSDNLSGHSADVDDVTSANGTIFRYNDLEIALGGHTLDLGNNALHFVADEGKKNSDGSYDITGTGTITSSAQETLVVNLPDVDSRTYDLDIDATVVIKNTKATTGIAILVLGSLNQKTAVCDLSGVSGTLSAARKFAARFGVKSASAATSELAYNTSIITEQTSKAQIKVPSLASLGAQRKLSVVIGGWSAVNTAYTTTPNNSVQLTTDATDAIGTSSDEVFIASFE